MREEKVSELLEEAAQARQLAATVGSMAAARDLRNYAMELEKQAKLLRAQSAAHSK